MARIAASLAAAIAGLLLLAGCSGSNTIDGVDDLKNAFVDAGGDCSNWNQDNNASIQASESGQCGDQAVLLYYADNPDGMLSDINYYESVGIQFIRGGHWIINNGAGENDQQITEKLGGKLHEGTL